MSAIVIGGIYPAAVQRFQVTPSAQTLEAPYIQRNIEATRAAYGLDTIKVTPYQAQTTATPAALREDADTIPGIRLIDPTIVSDAFRQLEQSRQYYTFPDSLDVDRYTIDGTVRDSVVSVRELNIAGNDQRNWYNDHVVYTHGFGLVAAYGQPRRRQRQPRLLRERPALQRRARHVRAAHLLRRELARVLDRRWAVGRAAA